MILKNFFFQLFIALMISTMSCSGQSVIPDESPAAKVPLGDPFIMFWNGLYYAYGTQSPDGIVVYISNDMLNWSISEKANGLALNKADVWAERFFWAPEVYHINGKFYMYYSADEHICVATGDSPLGPFKQDVQQPMIEGEKCIDNSLFIDEIGRASCWVRVYN